ncbi:MAG TPA: glycosyltransferase [Chloroflexota bacterium]|nr:glycosyltransferase [Chloroflexota bacterium]
MVAPPVTPITLPYSDYSTVEATLPHASARRARRHIAAWFDRYARERVSWRERNRYYYDELARLAQKTIPPGARVLELGCGVGDLLAAVQPSLGVGIDISEEMVRVAQERHAGSDLVFVRGDVHDLPLGCTFDYIICSDLIGHLDDIQAALMRLRAVCTAQTKVLITYYNFAWHSILSFAEQVGLKMPQDQQNWLGMADVENLLHLADFAVAERGARLILPKAVPGVAPLLNEAAIRVPGAHHLALISYWVVEPRLARLPAEPLSCSVIVPCRNEEGNIEACIERLPDIGTHTEVIFVDGASTDRTRERILDVIERYRGTKDIKLIDQVPEALKRAEAAEPGEAGQPVKMLRLGKGDAVRKAFAAATGDVLMILDADLTVPPEDLPKFLEPLAAGKAEFVNGTRLVYPLDGEAMAFHRMLGNRFFSILFTWLLEQRIKDTLCGTKVLRKRDYELLAANRSYFGDFDPFGDFDLLFGAARLGLRIVEVPVRYRRRTSGHTKVQFFSHGILLLKMSLIAFRRLKLARWLGDPNARIARPLPTSADLPSARVTSF